MQNSYQFKNRQQPVEEPVLEENEVVCEEKVPESTETTLVETQETADWIAESVPTAESEKNAAVIGVVVFCQKLRVRSEPSADTDNTVATLDVLSEVMVDEDASTEDFYKVCTAAGMEGFCMKKFIALRR